MLKSAVGISRKAYTCLFVPQLFRTGTEFTAASWGKYKGLTVCVHKGPKALTNTSRFHTGRIVSLAANRDTPLKTDVNEVSVDDLNKEDSKDTSSMQSFIPTVDTANMLFDGVPYKDLHIVHIKATWNNTHCNVTDAQGVSQCKTESGGTVGFKNTRKKSTVASQAVGLAAGQSAIAKGIVNVRVAFKGIGPGRLPTLKGLEMAGLNIVSLTDVTAIPFNGCRPRKQRRL